MQIFKQTIIALVLIAVLSLGVRMGIDMMRARVGSNYNGTSVADCLNDPAVAEYQNILVGTSVVREITDSPAPFMWKGEPYYVCGVSAPTTSLDFHRFLLSHLAHVTPLKGKTIAIEFSLQTVFDVNTMTASTTFIQFLNTPTLLSELSHHQSFKVYKKLLANLIFPLTNLRTIAFGEKTYNLRINAYHGKRADAELQQKQLDYYKGGPDVNRLNQDIAGLQHFAQKNGFALQFIVPPTNKDYVQAANIHPNAKAKSVLAEAGIVPEDIIDLTPYDNPAFFADCCHFNEIGQQAVSRNRPRK